jgi:hypothetical protein
MNTLLQLLIAALNLLLIMALLLGFIEIFGGGIVATVALLLTIACPSPKPHPPLVSTAWKNQK